MDQTTLFKMTIALLGEIQERHSRISAFEYSGCESSPCPWCQDAKQARKGLQELIDAAQKQE